MKLEDFKEILDEHGINYYESGASLALQECPECGSKEYKVLLRVVDVDENEPFFGRCQKGKCQEGYSSVKYLLKMGLPTREVFAAHGMDPQSSFDAIAGKKKEKQATITDAQPARPAYKETVINLDEFHRMSAWPNHPAVAYAKSRGINDIHINDVLINPMANAVVFICRNDKGQPIGWQQRFVKPTNPEMKTQTMDGWSKTMHIMEYPGAGDIVVCEGPFTAVSAQFYGFHAVCTFGSGMSSQQMDLIAKLSEKTGKNIGVAVEMEDRPRKPDEASLKCYRKMRSYLYWMNKPIFKVIPEVGKDLNDAWQAGKRFERIDKEDWDGPAIPEVDFFGV